MTCTFLQTQQRDSSKRAFSQQQTHNTSEMDPKKMQFALQQELRAKQEVVKGRHGKEVVLESVAPAAPPPPVPAVTVNKRPEEQLPPPDKKLLFSAGDLEKAKTQLADPSARSRSPSPAAMKGMQKDLVGDLRDVLAAKKRGRGGGGGGNIGHSSRQGPSIAKLDKALPK